MMSQDQKDKRSKLTLKLKLPNSDSKILGLKSTENKRISNSSVQVTIKGRKKDPQFKNDTDNKNLNNSEFQARQKALNNITNNQDTLGDTPINVLSKIKLDYQKQDALSIETDEVPEKSSAPQEEKSLPQEKATEEIEEKVPTTEQDTYLVDDFDVRNKIKQSIKEKDDADKEREKALEIKRKAEQEKITAENERKKPKKINKSQKFNDEEVADKKPKQIFKKEKFNSRRSLQTFIVDDDSFGGYRKKQKNKKSQKNQENQDYKKIINEVILPELISVSDLSDRMAEKTGDVVKKLFSMGVIATSNQVIDADTAELIISEFGHTVKRVKESDVEDILIHENEDNVPALERAPVVTIMGHVDHGKTSLLDAIKSTDIAGGESGGITQHIGASRVKTKSGKFITFLDTPGHEAFNEMRSRGANVTDIVILVVAADDGVKEQTIEAINHAKTAQVPIIVAINKIDKPNANSSIVKNELLAHEIISEDLGGDIIFVEVSAKEKTNLDKLEEAVLIQAEMMELKAPYDTKASGIVVETRINPSKGVITTLLVERGTLKLSDIVVAGTAYGKIKKINDDKSKSIKQALPSMPVEILGLNINPNAGDKFFVVQEEKQARDIIAYRDKKKRDEKSLKNSVRLSADVFKESGQETTKFLPIIIKGDVAGSVEALESSLIKLNTEEVAIKIIHSATGGVIESDINLAEISGATILGFNVKGNSAAKDLARVKNISIHHHSIIYHAVDEFREMLENLLSPIVSENYLGKAEIRQVFKVSKSGKIGGSMVTDGTIKKGSNTRLIRNGETVYDGILKTLKRFKEDAKEVKFGFECGCALENYEDIKAGDIIECYEIIKTKRSL